MKEIDLITQEPMQVVDITDRVVELVKEAGEGIALVSIPHTTAALLLSEDDEELRRDLLRIARCWLQDCGPFEHRKNNNPNTVAHVLSSFAGTFVTIGLSGGKLELGTYQRILFLELDGPKSRKVRLRILS